MTRSGAEGLAATGTSEECVGGPSSTRVSMSFFLREFSSVRVCKYCFCASQQVMSVHYPAKFTSLRASGNVIMAKHTAVSSSAYFAGSARCSTLCLAVPAKLRVLERTSSLCVSHDAPGRRQITSQTRILSSRTFSSATTPQLTEALSHFDPNERQKALLALGFDTTATSRKNAPPSSAADDTLRTDTDLLLTKLDKCNDLLQKNKKRRVSLRHSPVFKQYGSMGTLATFGGSLLFIPASFFSGVFLFPAAYCWYQNWKQWKKTDERTTVTTTEMEDLEDWSKKLEDRKKDLIKAVAEELMQGKKAEAGKFAVDDSGSGSFHDSCTKRSTQSTETENSPAAATAIGAPATG
ncbi:unnamed protein product [Amoebophrya sp. A120]|nr:unnamed protein product [Amoebophrya sp. A120]|eukprot:GSA120T00018727001.1